MSPSMSVVRGCVAVQSESYGDCRGLASVDCLTDWQGALGHEESGRFSRHPPQKIIEICTSCEKVVPFIDHAGDWRACRDAFAKPISATSTDKINDQRQTNSEGHRQGRWRE